MRHFFSGYMTDNEGDHPIELKFDVSNNWLTNIVYKNETLGGKIRMKCTRFSGIYTYPNNAGGYSEFLDYFTIVGKDGPKDFIMSMRRVGNCVYEGDAWVPTLQVLSVRQLPPVYCSASSDNIISL